jgi:hypothetical protein
MARQIILQTRTTDHIVFNTPCQSVPLLHLDSGSLPGLLSISLIEELYVSLRLFYRRVFKY